MRPSNLRHQIFTSPSPSPSPPSSPHPSSAPSIPTAPGRKPHCTHHPILSRPELDWLIRDFVYAGKHFNYIIGPQVRAHWDTLAVRFNAAFPPKSGGRERRFKELKCAMDGEKEAFLEAARKGYEEWRREREGERVAAEGGKEEVRAEGSKEEVRAEGGKEEVRAEGSKEEVRATGSADGVL